MKRFGLVLVALVSLVLVLPSEAKVAHVRHPMARSGRRRGSHFQRRDFL